jgi:hypothetical protein
MNSTKAMHAKPGEIAEIALQFSTFIPEPIFFQSIGRRTVHTLRAMERQGHMEPSRTGSGQQYWRLTERGRRKYGGTRG